MNISYHHTSVYNQSKLNTFCRMAKNEHERTANGVSIMIASAAKNTA